MGKRLNNLTESINFSMNLMEELATREDLTMEQKVILSIYRKLIEQIDGNFILADHNLRSSSIIMTRSALETYLSLKYIVQRRAFIKDRALSYYVGYLKNQKKLYNNILSNPPKIVTLSPEVYKNKIIKIEQILELPNLEKVLNEWRITKKKLNDKFRNNYDPKWYSLFDGPTSIKKLVNELNSKQLYDYYEVLSLEAHGYESLNGLEDEDIINGDFAFRPIRSTENIDHFAGMARSLCTSATKDVIQHIAPNNKIKFDSFVRKLNILAEYQ
ncbi:DUF5677 domain-containing protein [Bacillus cereus]|nr:DUF5677 domain-containing protein [Bacillus cereus]